MMQWEFLKRSFELGTLSHAYLLSGNDRAGKLQLLKKLLLLLGCSDKEAKELRHADLVVLEPPKEEKRQEISIGQVRELASRVSLGSWTFPFTLVLIFEAHALNQEAQSALLKLLEDPGGKTVFFLATEHPFGLLSTLRSRLQELRFWKFSFDQEAAKGKAAGKEFEQLRALDLHRRFVFAKELSESPERIEETLSAWILYARFSMLQELEKGSSQAGSYAGKVRLLEETRNLLQRTNMSARLALEQVMLEL